VTSWLLHISAELVSCERVALPLSAPCTFSLCRASADWHAPRTDLAQAMHLRCSASADRPADHPHCCCLFTNAAADAAHGPHPPANQDYELLEDNTGIRRQRPQQKHRRIKKARDAEAAPAQQQDAARALQVRRAGTWCCVVCWLCAGCGWLRVRICICLASSTLLSSQAHPCVAQSTRGMFWAGQLARCPSPPPCLPRRLPLRLPASCLPPLIPLSPGGAVWS
jgi:hypothetical protein